MHDKKRDLLWQTRIITEVYFFVVRVDVEGIHDRIPLRKITERGPKMGSHENRSLQRRKSIFGVPSGIGEIFEFL